MAGNKWQSTSTFLIGAAVGAGMALLFAPKSGEEMRDDIQGAVKDGVDGAIAQGNKVGRRVQKTYEDVKDRAREVVDAAEQGYREGKNAASHTAGLQNQ
jgi:gas vesicle protein